MIYISQQRETGYLAGEEGT